MLIYQVRVFNGKSWHVIRSYALLSEAEEWAVNLETEWDIKEVLLEDAVA